MLGADSIRWEVPLLVWLRHFLGLVFATASPVNAAEYRRQTERSSKDSVR